MNPKEKFKKSDAKIFKEKEKSEYDINTGWKQEWVSPKRLNNIKPIKIREVVRGPFYSPKLLKISPFVSLSPCREENDNVTRYKKTFYGGIPDPWTECLAIKGYCNEKQAGSLRKSCASRCMRFWITKTVWKEMGLPLIQGIPDPGRDYPEFEKTYKRCSSKRQKRDAFDTLPRSKSLPDSLEKHSTQKNLTFSNPLPSSNLVDENKNEGIASFVEGTKSFKKPKVSTEQITQMDNTKKNHNHSRSRHKNNNIQLRKAGGGNRKNSFSRNRDYGNIKRNTRSDRVYCYQPLEIGTQTPADRFERIPCQESSLQAILRAAKHSILPRKTYKTLKEKWTRMKDLSTLENTNRYFTSDGSCRCKWAKNFPTKIEEEQFDGLPTGFGNNYCARCRTYILKNKTLDCRCHESTHDYSRCKVRKCEKSRRSSNDYFLKKNPKSDQENAMIHTDLETVKELKLICSRCNYPYLKTNKKTEISGTTMDYLADRKNRTFVNNTTDDVSHRFQGKHTENKSTVPASSLRSSSKWDDLKFTCDMEHGCYKDEQDMKYVKADVQKTRRNVKETNVDTNKTGEVGNVKLTKEKILDERHDFPTEYKELMSSDSGVYADVSEFSKFDRLGDFSSVTSDTYLDRLNKSWISSKKYRNVNNNKVKSITIDRNTKQSTPFSDLSYNKSVLLQDPKEKNKEDSNYVKLPKNRSRSKTKSKLTSKREFSSRSTVKRKSRSKSKSKVISEHIIDSKTNHKSLPRSQIKSNNKPRKSSSKSRSTPKPKSRSKSRSRSRSRSRAQSSSKSRSRSRAKSSSKSRSRSRSRSRAKSRSNNKSRFKSSSKSRSRSRSGNKSRSLSGSGSKPKSTSNYESRSPSGSRSRPKSRSNNKSRSPFRSRSRSKSEPDSKSKHIKTRSKIHSSRSLKDSMIITKPLNSNLEDKNVKPTSKNATSSMTDIILDPGPCITNYFMHQTMYNDVMDTDNSVYSSTRNFCKTLEYESKIFPSKASLPKDNVTLKKKNCWLSKSDNYMNTSEREREIRMKNVTYRKANDCYLRYCNSRFYNSVQSLSDESSNVTNNSSKK